MKSITIELTNRCNLRCRHCFEDRHRSGNDLAMDVLDKVLDRAGEYGFSRLSFTGGEPTLHPEFEEVLRAVQERGYRFGFVSNGWNFADVYGTLLPFRDSMTGITFSLDGEEAVHDSLRGSGSFRRVIKALSVCVVKEIPFTVNTLITSRNCRSLENIAALVSSLGAGGLRFGHLLSNPRTEEHHLDLSPGERRAADRDILRFRDRYPVTIAIAPGYYTTELFPCDPLNMNEFNIDASGNVSQCCHLSGHGEHAGREDIAGNLKDAGFPEVYNALVEANRVFREKKEARRPGSGFSDADNYPCLYCLRYYNKSDRLVKGPGNPGMHACS